MGKHSTQPPPPVIPPSVIPSVIPPLSAGPAAPGQLNVVIGALRSTAKTWDDEADALDSITTRCKGMELGGIAAGVFQGIVGPYDSVCGEVANRCQEGGQVMRDIGTTLTGNANWYEATESANAGLALQGR